MTTDKLKDCGTTTAPCPQTPPFPAPLRLSPKDTTETVVSDSDAAKICRSPGTIQRQKDRGIQVLFGQLEDQWQDLIDIKARTLGRPTLQVHFKPVAEADKRRIGEVITSKPELSLQEAMDMATDLLLELWEGRAKKLIQEYKSVMGPNIVDTAKKRTIRAKIGAMRKAEELCAPPTTPTRPERPHVPVPKTPTQLPPCLETADTPMATVPPSDRPATQPPRYRLRVRPPLTVKAKEARELAATSIKPKRVAKIRPGNAETPTRGPNTPATGQPDVLQRQKQQTAPALPTAGMRELSVKDGLNALNELEESLIRPLHGYLNDVSEMINKELVKFKAETHAVQGLRIASVIRVALRSLETHPATAAHPPISSICGDVLLEWLSSHGDAIEVLNSKGLRPLQDVLNAVEHAKTDYYSQAELSSKKRSVKAKPGKRTAKNDDSAALGAVENSTTGRDLGPARPPMLVIGQPLSKDVEAPKKVVTFSAHNKPDRNKSLPESRLPSQHLQITKPQVLPCSDPFIASSPLPPASQPVWTNKTFPPDIAGGDLRGSILETRDTILKKITTELNKLDGSQPLSARQHMVLSTYHAVAGRLTEELGSLDEIVRREEAIRHEFTGLQKALLCIDMGDSEG